MTLNHLVLVGGGHTNVLLLQKWLMKPSLMPDVPITIISTDPSLVYSSMYPSLIARSITFNQSLIDIASLANRAKIAFIICEVKNIDFQNKEIIFKDRPSVRYSKLILNCGSKTKVSVDFQDLVKKKIACPVRPFIKSYQFIKNEDHNNSSQELPFVIIGSGLGAIEIAFALRKRWDKRKLILVCNQKKIANQFLKNLRILNIKVKESINFSYKKILLCTGNSPHIWIENSILELDSTGRIITNSDLRVKNFLEIYAVGDCAYTGISKNKSSGILAVKASSTLSENVLNDIRGKNLKKWFPQKFGLQIVNQFNNNHSQKAFAVYGKFVLGPSILFWELKNKIDNNFLEKFKVTNMKFSKKKLIQSDMDCRGCAAKIPQNVLNDSLRKSNLNKFADFPEDASEIFRSDKEIIIQSVDGFPALISDPWLNAKITTLHACSDLWACGAKVKSGQVLISIPKIDNAYQSYIFSQSLQGSRSTFDQLGAEIIGGHTFESRSFIDKPYTLEVEFALSVQGVLKREHKPWSKSGMKEGDILLLSRPLGMGIFFAAQMRNQNIFESYEQIFKDLITSQQPLIENIRKLEEKLGKEIVNAATDITGYGFLGHLNEMIEASNIKRRKENLKEIKVILDLNSFRAYPGILDLINNGIKSSLFNENNKILKLITKRDIKEQMISFSMGANLHENKLNAKKQLLCDPQTCGPLLISCDAQYEDYFDKNWYKVGVVSKKNI